ncbi:AAA family ATPase [Sanguibacter inulinus]|uniref:Adenylyl-sulfate kinase n=1 Tax=Sanguibacter inulinus TaxID=60922 RepID=A0A853ERC3_9MICO|nr:adenylyl-sulfate kinase [Sanguibacter inulinus]MBF0721137.1 adenylyl-sulfate kinase [Sanguibacter inulinus]NYS92282.1 adenylyl-sulfate kinase [Sanguibacter inulinus]
MTTIQILLLGGASGTGKTTVGWELSAILEQRCVAHCVIDGDTLGHIFPAPPGDPSRSGIVERNLASVWSGFAEVGQTRLIYTNTVSVLEEEMIRRAVRASSAGGVVSSEVEFTSVVLVAGARTVAQRLARRETGDRVDLHIDRSLRAAMLLQQRASKSVVVISTDGRAVEDVALEVLDATGW